ncbi:fibrinogen-like protein 1 [Gigantopelta aegis]|uniref:fibrinogen-like protein 1 n=1 Tax=Gigantopelta aegis TaxID=1735272 RepID=UPI001B88C0AC|nr:fibrinogen-like protein 1 [Gigantopelta aegis]
MLYFINTHILVFGILFVKRSLGITCGDWYGFKAVFLDKTPQDKASTDKMNVSRAECLSTCHALYRAKCKAFFYSEHSHRCQMYDNSLSCLKLKDETGTKGFVEEKNSPEPLAECSHLTGEVRSFQVPGSSTPIDGYFDSDGWLVIQRRTDGTENFDTSWTDYENGFGNLENEFWLGNKHIHSITSQAKYEIQFDVSKGQTTDSRRYAGFSIAGAADKYRLSIEPPPTGKYVVEGKKRKKKVVIFSSKSLN